MANIEPLENVFGARAGVLAGSELRKTSGRVAVDTPAGVFVRKGAAQALTVPANAGDVLRAVGVTIYTPAKMQNVNGIEFIQGDQIPVLSVGAIYCVSETAMVCGAAVFVRHQANGAGKLQLGAVRSDSDGGTATLKLGAEVLYDSTGTDPAVIQINLPCG
jgi:hypothetical protein